MSGYAALAHPWWIPIAWVLVLGHVTNICNTLYLHRSMTHGGVKFHPVVNHLMRFWIWFTTGIVTKEWVAVHRKHHAYSDREGDPHSPEVEGLPAILFTGLFFYRDASRDPELVEKYGRGCPDDWIERNLYTRFRNVGILLLLGLSVFLFGLWVGLLVWSAMAIWMPIMGNIINGIGHAKGYRNFKTKDHSHNIYPWGIWILGEELHNNHHADPRSAKFKAHWWEFDIGWVYIRILEFLGLADVVYARELSPVSFAEKYYGGSAATSRTTDRLRSARESALQELEELKATLEELKGRLEEAAASARVGVWEELEELKGRLEEAAASARTGVREELEEAKATLERAVAGARAGARGEVDGARRRLEEARQSLETAVARARAGLEQPEPSAD